MKVYIVTYVSQNGNQSVRVCDSKESAQAYANSFTNGNYYITSQVMYTNSEPK